MEEALYKQLLAPDDFRLVSLPYEKDRDAALRIELRTSKRTRKNIYDVLSYRWGSGTRSTIKCNGIDIAIPQNAVDALQALRARGRQTLWIDSICINQMDNKEKLQQIQHMSTIMRKSRRTIFWMGAETQETSAVFGLITQLIRARKMAFPDDRSNKSSLLAMIRKLSTRTTHLLGTISVSAIRNYREFLPPSETGTWKYLDDFLDASANPLNK